MFGITNSANIKNESGGGDVVYAIDNTNKGIIAGKKYWLTKRHLSLERAQYYQYNPNSEYGRFFFDKSGYIYQLNNTYWGRHWFDEEGNHQWAQLGSQTIANRYPYLFRERCGRVYATTATNSSRYVTFIADYLKDRTVEGYFYLGKYKDKEYAMSMEGNSVSFTVYEFDVETGMTVGEALCNFASAGGTIRSAAMDEAGNLYMDNTKDDKATIWDLSGVLDGTAEAPILLSTLTITSSESALEGGFTGFGVGDLLFCQTKGVNTNMNYVNGCGLKIYQLNSKRQLAPVLNLPTTLQNAIGTAAYVYYNDNTGILTLGTHENVYAYTVNKKTKVVTELNVGLPIAEEDFNIRDGAPYALYISDDFTHAAVTFGYYNGGYNYWCFKLYEFAARDNAWHATEDFRFGNGSTITGQATGNMNEAGLQEFNTVLPKVVTLTLNFEVEPDEFEFIGGVE